MRRAIIEQTGLRLPSGLLRRLSVEGKFRDCHKIVSKEAVYDGGAKEGRALLICLNGRFDNFLPVELLGNVAYVIKKAGIDVYNVFLNDKGNPAYIPRIRLGLLRKFVHEYQLHRRR